MIRKVSSLNVKLPKCVKDKKEEYVRTLQRRGVINRYYIDRKGKVVKRKYNKDGTTNFLAYDEKEYLDFKKFCHSW